MDIDIKDLHLIGSTAAPFQMKALDEGARTFSGLANTWEEDLGRDIVHRGAFSRTLEHWSRQKATRPIPLMDWHGWGSVRKVLGKLTDASETDDGLEAAFLVTKGNDGEEVLHRLRDGMLTGLSIGYDPVRWDTEQKADGTWVRHLREVKLLEVSLVVWPMNDSSRIDLSTVKTLLGRFPDGPAAAELRALLEGAPSLRDSIPPAPAPTGLAQDSDEVAALKSRYRRIRLRSLAR